MLAVLIVLKDLMVLGDWKPLILLQVSKMKCSHDCVSTKESTPVTPSTSWCLSAMWCLNLSTDSPQQRIPGFWNSESRYDSSFIFIIFHKHTYMSLVLFSGPWWLHLWLRFTKRMCWRTWCCPICLFLEGHPPYSSMGFALKPSFWSGISQRPALFDDTGGLLVHSWFHYLIEIYSYI